MSTVSFSEIQTKQQGQKSQHSRTLNERSNSLRIRKSSINEYRVRVLGPSSPIKEKSLGNRYNKYYVDPRHQFKNKVQNPKNDREILNSEHYIYQNLRNQEFWNWVHPFQKKKIPSYNPPTNIKDIDPKILQNFRKYIEQSPQKKRLPSIVEHVFKNNK